MKKKNNWKNKCVMILLAAALVLGGVLQTGTAVAWAAPSGGTVRSESINVRDGANGTPVASLKKGAEVTIRDEQQGSDGFTWYQITYDDGGTEKSGWVRSDLLDTDNSADTDADSSDGAQDSETNDQDPSDSDAASEEGGTDDVEGAGIFSLGEKELTFTESIPKDKIPKDFEETTITYLGIEVPALRHSQGEMILLCLKPTSEKGDAALYVYDQEKENILPFIKKKLGKDYVIFSDIPDEVVAGVSDTYTKGTCELSGGSLTAYQQNVVADNVASDAICEDFYYLYGMSKSGSFGWYVYDAVNGTVQRSIANMAYKNQETPDGDAVYEPLQINSTVRMIIGVLGVVCILLFVLVIIFSVRYRRLAGYADDGSDEEDWDDEKERSEEKNERPVKSDRKGGRRTGKNREKERFMEVEIPGGTVDLLDLDAEDQEGYDMVIPPGADYDLQMDNTPEDEKEFENLSAMLQKNLEKEIGNVDEEPEFFDEAEEISEQPESQRQPEQVKKQRKPEPDDDLEFL